MSNIIKFIPKKIHNLIKWLKTNSENIDQFIVTISLKNGSTFTIYDCYTYVEAMGLLELSKDSINMLAHDNEFICKK